MAKRKTAGQLGMQPTKEPPRHMAKDWRDAVWLKMAGNPNADSIIGVLHFAERTYHKGNRRKSKR